MLLFGAITVTDPIVEAWTGRGTRSTDRLPSLSVELFQVSVFLAAFSGLYLTVATVTDETYRAQFFFAVQRHLERAVGVRAVYLTLRGAGVVEPEPTRPFAPEVSGEP